MSGYRTGVYHALLSSYRGDRYIADSLGDWKYNHHPSERDFRLAYEIAMGTMRMTWTLDEIAKRLSKTGKLSLKLKEKTLVRMAIYQALFMKSLPLYAIADQMVQLAKSICHSRFIPFFNALLHALDGYIWTPPSGTTVADLSIAHSFPPEFIEQLQADYPNVPPILQSLNQVHPPMMRVRKGEVTHKPVYENCVQLEAGEDLGKWGSDARVYIQNATPIYLADKLAKNLPKPPESILDLCAAPGGKAIALHDRFPEAELWANEMSARRMKTLRANLEKYAIHAQLSEMDGLKFTSSRHFDLIVIDVPCSNTGVLGKKPEARLRLDKEHQDQLRKLQLGLLKHAAHFLKKDGQLWYMTCSILKDENERLIEASGLRVVGEPITVLPNADGWDGGFGVTLRQDK